MYRSKMKKNDYVYTPRFGNVKIEKVFRCRENAVKAGYTEPTYYGHFNAVNADPNFDVLGKSIGINCMIFAACRR